MCRHIVQACAPRELVRHMTPLLVIDLVNNLVLARLPIIINRATIGRTSKTQPRGASARDPGPAVEHRQPLVSEGTTGGPSARSPRGMAQSGAPLRALRSDRIRYATQGGRP